MLENYLGIKRVGIACGVVDLREGIDGLSMIIGDRYYQNPYPLMIKTVISFIIKIHGLFRHFIMHLYIKELLRLIFRDN